MKLLALAAFVAVCGAAKLDRTYLPPTNAKTAGGSEGSLQTPYSANSLENVGGLPKGSYTNEHQGVVVDAALAGTRMTGQSGLGAPRIQYGSTDSKVGSAAFRDRPSGGQAQAQGQQPRPWNYGLGGIPYRGPSQNSFNQPQENQGSLINQLDQSANQNQEPQQPERPRASLDRNANTVKLTSEVGPEDFKYSFETDNGITAEEKGVDANGVQAEGAFSYTGDDGQQYAVTYTADENGYQPKGDHLPTPPPIPEEILKALEQNARDEAAGINDDGSYDEKKYNGGSEYSNTDDGKYTHQSDGDTNNGQNRPFVKPNQSGLNTQQFGKPEKSGQSSYPNRPTLGHNAKPGKFDHERPSFNFGQSGHTFGKPDQSGHSSYQNRPTLGHNAKPGKFDHVGSSFNFDQSSQTFGKPNQSGFRNQNRPTLGHNAKPGKFDHEIPSSHFGSTNQQSGYQQSSSSGYFGQTGASNIAQGNNNSKDQSSGSVGQSSGSFGQSSGSFSQSSGSFSQSESTGSKPNFGFSSDASANQQSSQGLGNVNQYLPPNNFNSRPQSSQGVPETKPQEFGSSESSESSSSEEDSSEENTSVNKTPQQDFQDQRFPSRVSGKPSSNELPQSNLGSRPTQNSNFGQKPAGNFAQRQPSQPNFGFGNQNQYIPPFPQNPIHDQVQNQQNNGNYQAPELQSPFPKPSGNQGPFAQNPIQSQGFNVASQQNNGNYQVSGFQSSFSIPSGSQSPFAQNPTQNQDQGFQVANQPNSGNYQAPGFQSPFSKPSGSQSKPQRPIPSQAPSIQSTYESQQFDAFQEQNGNERFPPQQSGQTGQAEPQYGQSASPSTPRPETGLSTPSYTTPKQGNSNNQYSSPTPGSYLAPTTGAQQEFVIGPISISPVDQYKGPLLPGSQSQTSGSQFSPSTQRPNFSEQTNTFSQTSDSQFASSTQRPSYSQESNFESFYVYNQPSQSFSNQQSIPSNQGSGFPSQESTFSNQGPSFSPQGTGFPDQSSSFPSQESFSSSQASGFPTQESFSSSQVSSFPTQESFSSSQVSSFPTQESFSSSQVSSFPTQESFSSSQASGFPTQESFSSSQVSSFPTQESFTSSQAFLTQGSTIPTDSPDFQSSSNSFANSQSTPVQYSPQGPINYPNPPTIPSAAPTSSTQYHGQTVSGITQASASSYPYVSTPSSLNAQSQFQSLPGFQQSTNYNQGSTNSLSFDQSTTAPQTIPQNFNEQDQQSLVDQYQGSQLPGSQSPTSGDQFSPSTQRPSTDQQPDTFSQTIGSDNQFSSQSVGDSKPVLTQQYDGEIYEYNKPAQLPPAPENEGQPGAGQFGTTQETTQQDNDGSNTKTPEFGSQSSSQQQFEARPQSTLSPEGINYTEQQSTIDSNQFDSQYNQDSQSLSTPQSAEGVNPSQSSFTNQSQEQYSQFDDQSQSQYTYNGDSQAPPGVGSQSQSSIGDQSTQNQVPEYQEQPTKAPFGLRPCCQGSKKPQKPRPPRPLGFNSGFNAAQNRNTENRPTSSFTGQKEVFDGQRKPPSFDENGYHY